MKKAQSVRKPATSSRKLESPDRKLSANRDSKASARITVEPVAGMESHEKWPSEKTEHEGRPENDRLRLLLLCNYDVNNAATVCDHINNFVRHSRHQVTVVSKLGSVPDAIDFNDFDIIVIHYSLTLALDAYVSSKTKNRLAEFPGLKVLFIQDEYRFVRDTEAAIRRCGIQLVYTVLPQEIVPKVYNLDELPGVRFVTTLTGYVPDWLKVYSTVPLSDRRFDVGYRGRTYPAWHGKPGIERIEIGHAFARMANKLRLRVNIRWGEKDRLYGADWVEFTRQCRATLSTESRISVIDRDGSISNRYNAFVDLLGIQHPDKGSNVQSLRRLGIGANSRSGWFQELKKRFFSEVEDRVTISVISPRVFEAAALRSLLVMYEGHYSGVLQPWRHYLPLKKDHSNIAEIADFIRDDVRCAEMIANCFAEVACNPEYSSSHFMAGFDTVVATELESCEKSKVALFDQSAAAQAGSFYFIENPHGVVVTPISKTRVFGILRKTRNFVTSPREFMRKLKRRIG